MIQFGWCDSIPPASSRSSNYCSQKPTFTLDELKNAHRIHDASSVMRMVWRNLPPIHDVDILSIRFLDRYPPWLIYCYYLLHSARSEWFAIIKIESLRHRWAFNRRQLLERSPISIRHESGKSGELSLEPLKSIQVLLTQRATALKPCRDSHNDLISVLYCDLFEPKIEFYLRWLTEEVTVI